MAHSQSSTQNLKRNLAVFGVIFVGVGILLHVTIPWFDFLQVLGTVTNLAGEYPKVAVLGVGIVALLFIVAKVDDLFS